MKKLAEFIGRHEDWLMDRVVGYAKQTGYSKYTATLAEAWRISIAGLSRSLVQCLLERDRPAELSPDEDFTKDPVAAFGIVEAQRHRRRGVSLPMFLGLMKYYRQAYCDLLDAEEWCAISAVERYRYRLSLDRFFDRVELGFCAEWAQLSAEGAANELQSANRYMTNEKNKFHTVFESLLDPVILFDDTGEIQQWNHAAERIFGSGTVPGVTYYSKTDRQQSVCGLDVDVRDFIKNSQKERIYERVLTLHSERRFYEMKLTRSIDVSGQFQGTIVTLHDITERKDVENALRESEEKFKRVVGAARDAILLMTADGKVAFLNAAAEEMFGWNSTDLLGKDLHDVLAPERFRGAHRNALPSFAATGRGAAVNRSLELVALRRDGTEIPIELSLASVMIHEQWYGIGIIRDLTAQKMEEQERRDFQRKMIHTDKLASIGTLAAGVAHEINNPLTVILGNLEMMSDLKDSRYARSLEKINSSVRRITAIVKELRQLARADADILETVDLAKLIEDTLVLVDSIFSKDGVKIARNVQSGCHRVNANRGKLQQVLMNLLTNGRDAIQETKKEGLVTVSVFEEGEFVVMDVTDDGAGIPSERLKYVFDPFYTTKDPGKGTGLGLSISHSIVTSFKGRIEVESQPGEGARFRVLLPRG